MTDLTMTRLHEIMVILQAISLVFYFIDYLQKDQRAHRLAVWLLFAVGTLQTIFLVMYMVEMKRFPILSLFEGIYFYAWLIIMLSLVLQLVFRLDLPAFFMNFMTQKVGLFENGLINASTVLYYPLSPKLLLIAFHPQHLVSTCEEKDCCIKRISADKEKAFIHKYNEKQIEQCNNFVYGRNRALLENLLRERM